MSKVSAEKKEISVGRAFIFKYIKSLLLALIITFASIILFAFIIKWANLNDSVISPVNMVIKGVSVFLGSLVLTKGGSGGLLKGFIFAILYTLLSFVVFSLLAGTFVLGLGLISDVAFLRVVGAIGGVLGVNIRRKDWFLLFCLCFVSLLAKKKFL